MNKRRWILLILIPVFMTGCLGNQNNSSGNDSTADANPNQLPPAWTPTPISVPGSGADLGTWQPCKDAPASRLEVGISAVLQEGTTFSLQIRTQPSLYGEVAGEIRPTDVIQIVNGPTCEDHLVWWEVQLVNSGDRGWVAEGNDYGSWLVRSQ